MSTPLVISCPHCGSDLKLKNNGFVGKKVPCPKCRQPFLVGEPEEDEFLAQDDDDFGAMDEPEDEPEPPRSRGSKAKGAKSKKKSKSGGGASIVMIGGAIILGLGLLGGVVYGAMALFSGGSSNSWVKWLPSETDVAIQVRVADSINAPIFKPILDNPTLSKLMNDPPLPSGGGANPAQAFLQSLNIQAKDIETVTIGVVDGMSQLGENASATPQMPQQFVAVVRLKTPVEEAKLTEAPATVLTKEDYSGKNVYAVVNATNPRILVHAVDSTTFLVGSDAELKAAIDGKGSAPASKRFSFVNDKSSFVFVAAPKDTSKLKALGITTLQQSRGGAQNDTGKVDGIYGVSYGFTLGSDLNVEMRSSLSRSMAKATSEQMKKEMDELRPALQAQMAQAGGFNPLVSQDAMKKILGHVDTMLGSAQASSSGSTATLSMTLSGQIVSDGMQMAAPFMPILEAQIKMQQAAGGRASPMSNSPMGGMSGGPSLGNSPSDITAYPGQVIEAGENAKQKIGDIGDQHNAAIEAEMQEGSPGFGAGMTSGPGLPGGASGGNDPNRAGMEGMMRGGGPGLPGGASNGPPGGGDPTRGGMEAQMRNGPGLGGPPGGGDPNRAGMEAQMRGGPGLGGPPGGGDPNRAGMEAQMRGGPGGGGPPGGAPNRGGMEAQMRNGPGGAGPPGANGADGQNADKPVKKSRRR